MKKTFLILSVVALAAFAFSITAPVSGNLIAQENLVYSGDTIVKTCDKHKDPNQKCCNNKEHHNCANASATKHNCANQGSGHKCSHNVQKTENTGTENTGETK